MHRDRGAALADCRHQRLARGVQGGEGEGLEPLEQEERVGGLLGEVGIALVGVASSADDEATYWQCMEAIDAADESRDRVLEMLRKLADRDQVLPEV